MFHRSCRPALALAVALLLTACSDDGTSPTTDPTATSAPTTPATATDDPVDDGAWVAAADEACAAFGDAVSEALSPIFESEGEPDPDAVLAVFVALTPELASLRDQIGSLSVEGDGAADRDQLVAGLEVQLGEWEAATASADAAVAQLQSQDGAFTRDLGALADDLGVHGCGTGTTFQQDELDAAALAAATRVDVSATEYSFETTTELSAGDHVFAFENAGGEEHEMILVGLDAETTYEDAMAWLEENAETDEEPDFMTGFWGGFAGPNGRTEIAASLEPGTYAMVCFLPAPDEQPHLAKGMHVEVTVS